MKIKNSVENELKKWLLGAERIAIIGVGNPILMDDSVGIKVVQDMKGKVPSNVLLVECETVPENHVQEIIDFKPTRILIVDAAMLGLKPGEIALLGYEDLKMECIFSTHFLPIRLFCEYIMRVSQTEIKFLLIQPKQVCFGEDLSPEVLLSKEKVVKLLLSTLSAKKS